MKLLSYLILLPVMTYSISAMAYEPIVLKVSDSKFPPTHTGHYEQIGYWDVDDLIGNTGEKNTFSQSLSGRGTYMPPRSKLTKGSYMASLAIDRDGLGQITELTITASNTPVWKILSSLKQSRPTSGVPNKKMLYKNGNLKEYVVGVWDVDGGGGFGVNGSKGKYGMTLSAKIRNRSSDRRLLDLKLIASNGKSPSLLAGYELVGYWDVDKGGARGTDNSKGSYMMTLLAKWNR